MSSDGVHKHVDIWQGKRVLWAHLVEVCEVDTDPPFVIFLLYYYKVCQPIRIMHLTD